MSDDTPVTAVRQAMAALRAGTVTRALDAEDLGLLGAEARALVEHLIDVLQSVDRATTDPRAPHTRDLNALRERLASALSPVDVAGDPRDRVGDHALSSTRPDDQPQTTSPRRPATVGPWGRAGG